MGKGVRTVDENLDSLFSAQANHVADGQDLPGKVGDLREFDDFGLGSDRFADAVGEDRCRRQGNRERDLLDDDPLTPSPLLPACDHTGVVLISDDDLITAFEIDAEDQGLHRLGSVPGDCDFLGVAAKFVGKIAAHRFDPRLENPPHVLNRRLVRESKIADHLVEHVGGRRTDAAVVEVDDVAVVVECALDLRPVVFVGGKLAGFVLAGILIGAGRAGERVFAKRGTDQAGNAGTSEERPSGSHDSPSVGKEDRTGGNVATRMHTLGTAATRRSSLVASPARRALDLGPAAEARGDGPELRPD